VPTYVALGSSFASGPGIDPIIDAGCGRSGSNYAHLLAERLGYDLIDATCGGAAIDDLLTRPQALMTGGTVPPQVEALVPDADLVTVTVGGNDIEYLRTLLHCSYRADPQGTPVEARPFFETPVDRGAQDAALALLPAKMVALVGAVRERAPAARVVLVDYLTVVTDDEGAGLPLSDEHRRRCAGVARRLAAATAEAARTTGVDLVTASAASSGHHAGSREPWVTGWEFGDVPAGGVVPYHPNAAGMRAVADLLVSLLGRSTSEGPTPRVG
jgi:lysophospholipase L1-like esterase